MTHDPRPVTASAASQRRTRLVATLGPATDDDAVVRGLLQAGLDVARINTAHGGPEDIRRRAEQVRRCAAEVGREVALLLDLQGPKIRIGRLPAPRTLAAGQDVWLAAEGLAAEGLAAEGLAAATETPAPIPVSYPALARDVRPGEAILLADGLIRLEALETDGVSRVRCRVVAGGVLTTHKGVNLPESVLSATAPTPRDLQDAQLGLQVGVDFLGLSFVRAAADIERLRAAVGPGVAIVAKIERPEALRAIDEIVRAADVVMVARGDLGVELPLEQVPQAELAILRAAHQHGTPAIVATELLESMQVEERPTRAEVTDVFYAVANLADAVMLSAETAVGRHPVATLEMLGHLAHAAEATLAGQQPPPGGVDVPAWVAYSAVVLADALGARALIAPTSSGRTACQVARFRPRVPIVAVVPDVGVARRLALTWGVTRVVAEMAHNTDQLVQAALRAAREAGHVADGDIVVLTAGVPVGKAGSTNLVKVHRMGEASL